MMNWKSPSSAAEGILTKRLMNWQDGQICKNYCIWDNNDPHNFIVDLQFNDVLYH
jgi:hypothetical protein